MARCQALLLIFFLVVISISGYAAIEDGLTHIYNMSSGADEIGGKTLTVGGGLSLRSGKECGLEHPNNKCYLFDGATGSDIMYIANGNSMITTEGFTICIWANVTNTTNTIQRMWSQQDAGTTYDNVEFTLRFGTSNYVEGWTYENAAARYATQTFSWSAGQKHFVCFANRDLATDKIVASFDKTIDNDDYDNAYSRQTPDDKYTYIGCRATSPATTCSVDKFAGYLDEIWIWNRGLSDQELQMLANTSVYYNGSSGTFMNYNVSGGTPAGPDINMSITLNYPINESSYTNYTGFVNVTLDGVNGSAICAITNPYWIENTTGPYVNETVLFLNPDVNYSGVYNMVLSCADDDTNVTVPFIFTIEPWKINATDLYTGNSITIFDASVSGRGDFSTADGLLETDIPANYPAIFDVNISAANYITREYINIATNETFGSLIYQSLLRIFARDVILNTTLSTFLVHATYKNFSGSAGVADAYLTAGLHTFNVTSEGYGDYIFNFTTVAGSTNNVTLWLQPYINISIFREKYPDEIFDTSLTQQTKLYFYCPLETVEQEFDTATNQSNVYIPVACPWDFIKLDVIYNDTSYFRTLIPEFDNRDIKFYMLDLQKDLGVQIILRLNDLVGDYNNGKVYISRPIDEQETFVIQQLWDMEAKATLYLLKDAYYTVRIVNNDGTIIRSLGSLVADAAEEKIITVPELEFVPDKVLGSTITWSWSDTDTSLRLIYNDSLTTTTSLHFAVYYPNLTLAYQTTQPNLGFSSFTYITGNESFMACMNTTNQYVQYSIFECHLHVGKRDSALGDFTGWDTTDLYIFLTWICTAVVVLVLLFFMTSPEWGLGMAAVLCWVFMKIGWLTYGSSFIDGTVLTILGLLAALTMLKGAFR